LTGDDCKWVIPGLLASGIVAVAGASTAVDASSVSHFGLAGFRAFLKAVVDLVERNDIASRFDPWGVDVEIFIVPA